jgi:diguanylate cyclase (GGDEF)-like protein/PAS domain S-box-containing protein
MQRLPVFLNTPAGVVIVVGLIVLAVEFSIMLLVSGFAEGSFLKVWYFIDPILLTALVSPALYILIFRPMRDQQAELERKLVESRLNEQLTALIEAIPDAVFLKDGEGRWLITNEPAKQLFQLHDIPWQGKTEMELADLQPAFRAAHEGCLASDEKAWQAGRLLVSEESVPGEDGRCAIIESRKAPVFSKEGQRKGLAIIGRDITELKAQAAHIEQLAFYDSLTGLPNRSLLRDRLQQAMAVGGRSQLEGALLFIGLDNFKMLNDTKGRDIGDLLLIEVATRLQDCMRSSDTVARLGGTVARLGNDEFVVIINELSKNAQQAAAQAHDVGERVLASINQPFNLQGFEHYCTASIGISLFRGDEIGMDGLLKQADIAMYQAKTSGRNTVRFFDPDMQATLEARATLEADLHHALSQQQFKLFFQIQVNAANQPIGAEALLRWQHPKRGLVAPLQFIPLAEDTGLVLPIGLWVLETACAQIKAWEANPLACELQLAVNVSARQFHQPDFVEQVRAALNKTGADPTRLKLELTESVVLDNINNTVAKMHELKEIGVRFSMDDFGTGYSSLSYLTQLPLDQLKIDQSFMRNIGTKPTDAVIVQTIISMGNSLGMEVIAEGVENEEQRDFLERNGCRAYQGYLFSKPVPIGEFEALIRCWEIGDDGQAPDPG